MRSVTRRLPFIITELSSMRLWNSLAWILSEKSWACRFRSSWVAGFAMRLGSRAISSIAIQTTSPATNVRDPAVDVILLDTTFWGGIRACVRAAQICDTFGLVIAVHSSGELG